VVTCVTHSLTGSYTLDYVEVTHRYPDDDFSLEQLLLKLTEHKVLMYSPDMELGHIL